MNKYKSMFKESGIGSAVTDFKIDSMDLEQFIRLAKNVIKFENDLRKGVEYAYNNMGEYEDPGFIGRNEQVDETLLRKANINWNISTVMKNMRAGKYLNNNDIPDIYFSDVKNVELKMFSFSEDEGAIVQFVVTYVFNWKNQINDSQFEDTFRKKVISILETYNCPVDVIEGSDEFLWQVWTIV